MSVPETVESEKTAVLELPRPTDEDLLRLEEFDDGDGAIPSIITSVVRELRALRQTVSIAQGDAEKWQQEHANACVTIAMMHCAAVGDRNGPRQGLVEDVAMLRQYAIRSRVALDDACELSDLQEKRIADLTKARDTLGAMALQKSDPKNEVERARIKTLLKAGHVDTTEEAPTIVQG